MMSQVCWTFHALQAGNGIEVQVNGNVVQGIWNVVQANVNGVD